MENEEKKPVKVSKKAVKKVEKAVAPAKVVDPKLVARLKFMENRSAIHIKEELARLPKDADEETKEAARKSGAVYVKEIAALKELIGE